MKKSFTLFSITILLFFSFNINSIEKIETRPTEKLNINYYNSDFYFEKSDIKRNYLFSNNSNLRYIINEGSAINTHSIYLCNGNFSHRSLPVTFLYDYNNNLDKDIKYSNNFKKTHDKNNLNNNDCVISNVEAEVVDCQSDVFQVSINFDYENEGDNGFKVTIMVISITMIYL